MGQDIFQQIGDCALEQLRIALHLYRLQVDRQAAAIIVEGRPIGIDDIGHHLVQSQTDKAFPGCKAAHFSGGGPDPMDEFTNTFGATTNACNLRSVVNKRPGHGMACVPK